MADNRLIINARGETFKAFRHDGDSVTLQCLTLADRVSLDSVTFQQIDGRAVCTETAFSVHDVRGIIIQLANAIGDAVELTPLRVAAGNAASGKTTAAPRKQPPDRGGGYVMKCLTPGAK